MMVSPEAWPGILQEHPAVITTGGVNMCPHGPPIVHDGYLAIGWKPVNQ